MKESLEAVASARAVLIAGPTASGKSAMALRLAAAAMQRGRQAWVVNADAMQVYDALRILTARPGPAEESRVRHRLYGHVPAQTRYSVGAWLADMEHVLTEAERRGVLAIVAGGTGLYFKALTNGIAAVSPIPSDVQARMRQRLEKDGAAALHADLQQRDPASAASIRPGDTQRVLRALQVLEATGTGLRSWQSRAAKPPLLGGEDTLRIVLDTPRPSLHARIEERFDRMVEMGAIDEVRALLALNLDPELPVMKAIGVREFASYIRGEASLDDAVARAKAETRRYAKRQSTWMRNQMRDWTKTES